MNDQKIRQQIKNVITAVIPHDKIEQNHINNTLNWIDTGVEIFRIKKDAIPPKHLVSYSVVIDRAKEKILLFDHKKALLLLPSGGHVDLNEMPANTATRELKEELDLSLDLYSPYKDPSVPFFLSIADTVGISEKHTDVSLWYLFDGDSKKKLDDAHAEYQREFNGYQWLSYDEILSMPLNKFSPDMHRFVEKLQHSFSDNKSLI